MRITTHEMPADSLYKLASKKRFTWNARMPESFAPKLHGPIPRGRVVLKLDIHAPIPGLDGRKPTAGEVFCPPGDPARCVHKSYPGSRTKHAHTDGDPLPDQHIERVTFAGVDLDILIFVGS